MSLGGFERFLEFFVERVIHLCLGGRKLNAADPRQPPLNAVGVTASNWPHRRPRKARVRCYNPNSPSFPLNLRLDSSRQSCRRYIPRTFCVARLSLHRRPPGSRATARIFEEIVKCGYIRGFRPIAMRSRHGFEVWGRFGLISFELRGSAKPAGPQITRERANAPLD